MKENNPEYVSDATIHRLVDGALEGREYQDVLRRLANSSGGWKRCSMAFLEVQALKKELGDIDFSDIELENDQLSTFESSDSFDPSNSGFHRLWETLMVNDGADKTGGSELGSDTNNIEDSLVTSDSILKPVAIRHRGSRRFWTNLAVGSVATAMCLLLSVKLFSPVTQVNFNEVIPVTSYESGMNQVDYISTQVPVGPGQGTTASDTFADFEFVESLVSPLDFRVGGTSTDIKRLDDGSHRYETQIGRIKLIPRNTDRFR